MARSPGMHNLNTFTRLAFLSSPDGDGDFYARELLPPPRKGPAHDAGATTPRSPYAASADGCSSPELPASPDAWDSDESDPESEESMEWSPCAAGARRGTVSHCAGFVVAPEDVGRHDEEWAGASWATGRLEGLGLTV